MSQAMINKVISENAVAVFSKSYCPYCVKVKNLFNTLGVKNIRVVELDQSADGSDVQSQLKTMTNQSTVPNVFIGGKHIGGCDATMALKNEGKLDDLLKNAGAF
eukprot:TRINITY_DN1144_c0_g1_i1.p1 TRINITY_DN1144_c0_g1~~TRINITY_DN1144_c0_g1_i1.p1  ORF type:complete len:104 (-),score=32.64 TRINITY_DN1144_c0_g1_i1:58-369(-)